MGKGWNLLALAGASTVGTPSLGKEVQGFRTLRQWARWTDYLAPYPVAYLQKVEVMGREDPR